MSLGYKVLGGIEGGDFNRQKMCIIVPFSLKIRHICYRYWVLISNFRTKIDKYINLTMSGYLT